MRGARTDVSLGTPRESTVASPRVSVIICNYNYGGYLSDAIGSVLRQTYENVECILVDDGSTDDSRQALRPFLGKVQVIFQPNRGLSAARNRGMRAARGELVAFLDADDMWHPRKLERQVALLESSDAGMVFSEVRYIDERGGALGMTECGSGRDVLEEMVLMGRPGVPAAGSCAVIRRSVFTAVGEFDETLSTSADWDMWRRIACRYGVERVREPLALCREHDRALHHDVESLERDMTRALQSTFIDPSARSVHPLRSQCYGHFYIDLARKYWHAHKPAQALRCLSAGVTAWPRGITHVVPLPLRRLLRVAA